MISKFKYSIITFFILSLFLSILIQSFLLVNYVVNQESYTEEFCENIDTPSLNCHGTCHLTKELKFNNSENELSTEEVSVSIVSIFSFQQLNQLASNIIIRFRKDNIAELNLSLTKDYISSVFKPPCFS